MNASEVVERAVAELIDLHREDAIRLGGAVLDLVHLVEPGFQTDTSDDAWRVM